MLGLKIQSSRNLRCCHTSSIRIKYFYVIIIDEKYSSHFFSFSKQSSLRLMFPRTAPALVIIRRPHHRSQSQVMGAGARCWLSCLPGKFRSITLKLNSNTESACLSSGPGASQHSINLTFNRPQNSYKQFKQTGISTPGSF